jgi:hypothetical protein
MKIIDVVVGGVSVELTERREFASVVQQTAIDGLIGTLRSRVNDLPQAEATQDWRENEQGELCPLQAAVHGK